MMRGQGESNIPAPSNLDAQQPGLGLSDAEVPIV